MDTLVSAWIWALTLLGMNTNTITATPNPVAPGAQLKICYDFGPGETSANLRITWTSILGEETSQDVTVTPDKVDPDGGRGCVKVTVPMDAVAAVIDDLSGDAQPETIAVSVPDGGTESP